MKVWMEFPTVVKVPLFVQTCTPVSVTLMLSPSSLRVVPAPMLTMPADSTPPSWRFVPLVVVSKVAPAGMVRRR